MMNSMKLSLKNRQGLTLIEFLIVVAIIALLTMIALSQFNLLQGRDKAIDSHRKSDLDRLKISMEDCYGDKGCYPTPHSPAPALPCGGDTDSEFHLYLGTIPCDPNTGQAYSYNPEDVDCPSYYRIYTKLSWQNDPQIVEVGCAMGCGPDYVYNYGVSSPNVGLIGEIPICVDDDWWLIDDHGICNIAGSGCCYLPGATLPDSCGYTKPISECYCGRDDCCNNDSCVGEDGDEGECCK